NLTYVVRERVGLAVNPQAAAPADEQQSLDHIKRIWGILRETQGFDAAQLLPLIPRLLSKPETQHMGQQIASGLAQRLAARFIREVLLKEDSPSVGSTPSTPAASSNGPRSNLSPKLALPAAAPQ
ncbi:MAG TPA: AarF/ABC1/UbiB kinase family protein, partial [Allocoleopsis sp.]